MHIPQIPNSNHILCWHIRIIPNDSCNNAMGIKIPRLMHICVESYVSHVESILIQIIMNRRSLNVSETELKLFTDALKIGQTFAYLFTTISIFQLLVRFEPCMCLEYSFCFQHLLDSTKNLLPIFQIVRWARCSSSYSCFDVCVYFVWDLTNKSKCDDQTTRQTRVKKKHTKRPK